METFKAITQLIEKEIPVFNVELALVAQEKSNTHLLYTLINFPSCTERMMLHEYLLRVKKYLLTVQNAYKRVGELMQFTLKHIFISPALLESNNMYQTASSMLPFHQKTTYLMLYRPNHLE